MTSTSSETQRLLLLLDLVPLRLALVSVLGLDLRSFLSEAKVHLLFDIVTASNGLMHEALVVAVLESRDDLLAR